MRALQIVPEPVVPYVGDAVSVGEFLAAATAVYLLGRYIVQPAVTRVVRARNRYNPTIQSAVDTYLGLLVLVAAVFAGLVAGGYTSLTSPALVIAALTVAIGVAGQEVFGSLVSGLFLVADPNFSVGDFVTWSEGEGTVETVGFRATRIRTPAYETVTVPNTVLTTNTLRRPYGRKRARVDETVHLTYDDEVELACDLLAETAREDDRVLADPEPDAVVDTMGEGLVTLRAMFWVDEPTNKRVDGARRRFRREVVDRFSAAGITLGPPNEQDLSGEVTVTGPEGADDRTDGRGRAGEEGEGR